MAKVDLTRLMTETTYKPSASDLRLLAKELETELHNPAQLEWEELRIFNTLNWIESCWCWAAIVENWRCNLHLNS